MDLNKDYYKILGVQKNATIEDIKKAYKTIAKQHHPDKTNGDVKSEEIFKQANEANDILSDTKSKQQYDTTSPHGNNYNPNMNNFGGNIFDMFNNDFFNFSFNGQNPFENIFNQKSYHENLDITINVVANLKDVYNGNSIKISYNRYNSCPDCKGTGFDRSSESYKCEMCDGKGFKHHPNQKCEYCKGEGKIYSGTCKKCNGEKIILEKTEFNLNNTKSIRNSQTEYLKGFGHQSRYYQNKRGVVVLNIIYEHINDYVINGNILEYKLNLHFQDAINGGAIDYVNLDGKTLKISIPEKTKDDTRIRLKNKGLLVDDTNREDLYFRINIIIDYDRLENDKGI